MWPRRWKRAPAAILCREPPRTGSWLSTPDPRAALARVSAAWFGYPGEEMTLIGVTGTNGKTTTTYLIKAMLEGALKTRVGLIGTNRNLIGALELPATALHRSPMSSRRCCGAWQTRDAPMW